MGNQPSTLPFPSSVSPAVQPRGGFQVYGRPGFGHGFVHHGSDHHWLALVLFILLVAALVVLAISVARIALRKPAVTAPSAAGTADDALATLRMRYARGEIGREEYLLAHGDLGGTPPPAEGPQA